MAVLAVRVGNLESVAHLLQYCTVLYWLYGMYNAYTVLHGKNGLPYDINCRPVLAKYVDRTA